jgi:hypothetical protein
MRTFAVLKVCAAAADSNKAEATGARSDRMLSVDLVFSMICVFFPASRN